MVAISSLLLVVTVSLLITRVATVILTATGMSREAARFQARSAFSGAGFTTRESEAVIDHPVRRKVIATLMLLGSAGIVAVVSTLILGLGRGDVGQRWWRVLELVVGLLAIVFVSRSRWVDRRLTALIGKLLQRYTELPGRDVAGLVDLAGGYAVTELAVGEGDWIAGRTLGDLRLRDEGIVVLGINRPDGRYVTGPRGSTLVAAGDVLVLYGQHELLAELDTRPRGSAGDLAHTAGVSRQTQARQAERERENAVEIGKNAGAAPYPPEDVRSASPQPFGR
jgi:hypothetical protein